MLRQLLSILADGGLHSRSELAASLGTSEALVDQMLRLLADRGHVVYGSSCESMPACSRCESGAGCPIFSGGSHPTRMVAVRTTVAQTRL